MQATMPPVRCRQIEEIDLDAVLDLLVEGFPAQTRAHWVEVLRRLSAHDTPAGYAKYGYLLEQSAVAVGVLLLIFAKINEKGRVRCSVSSWYVRPSFRGYAAFLASRALRHREVVYFNMTPAPHTRPILEAQGYRLYCTGGFVAAPILKGRSGDAHVEVVGPRTQPGTDLTASEIRQLLDHAGFGCLSLIVHSAEGRSPFVFLPRRRWGIPYAYLAYCRDQGDFVRFAGVLGQFLMRRRLPLVILDADAPIAGL
ncbi:MAG: acyl-CoA acyltransferase, partial [Xanthobacteraceae bacterium]|nr:acyl-CoA acyltransferase [Xanthobacteraceae bacterium]